MSTDYIFGLGVGFELPMEQVLAKWGKQLPEVSHLEDRFDPKSGKKVEPEKIVDRAAGRFLVLGDKEFDIEGGTEDAMEVAEAISALLELDVEFVNEGPDGCSESAILLVSPSEARKLKDVSTTCLCFGHVEGDGGFALDDLAKLQGAFKKAAARLKKLGLKAGKPMVRVTGSWG